MFKPLLQLILCLLVSSSLLAEDNFKVGVIIAQTGAAAKYGKFAKMGLELAQEKINRTGGIEGKPVELIFEDSQTQPNQALSAFNKLKNIDQVDAIIGDVWEFLTNSFLPQADKTKTVVLSPTTMPHAITITSSYFFTMGHQIDYLDSAFRLYFKKHPEIKKLALINWDNTWGLGYGKKIKEIIKELNIELVEELSTQDWNTDAKSEVTRVLRKKPDVIFAPYLGERIARRLKEFKSPTKILTTLNIVESLLDESANKEQLEDIYFVDFTAPEEYNKKFQERFKEVPQFESHLSYEALRSLVKAYTLNPKDLQAGLKGVTYQGVSGEIDFTKSNNGNNAAAALYQIKDGKAELIK